MEKRRVANSKNKLFSFIVEFSLFSLPQKYGKVSATRLQKKEGRKPISPHNMQHPLVNKGFAYKGIILISKHRGR